MPTRKGRSMDGCAITGDDHSEELRSYRPTLGAFLSDRAAWRWARVLARLLMGDLKSEPRLGRRSMAWAFSVRGKIRLATGDKCYLRRALRFLFFACTVPSGGSHCRQTLRLDLRRQQPLRSHPAQGNPRTVATRRPIVHRFPRHRAAGASALSGRAKAPATVPRRCNCGRPGSAWPPARDCWQDLSGSWRRARWFSHRDQQRFARGPVGISSARSCPRWPRPALAAWVMH